jgi:dihydrolipoamide dehydrogenase
VSAKEFDLVVLGAGPAGYVAGIRAAQLGLKACVVEKDRPGGVCLNLGCIPSKSLIHDADTFAAAAELEEMGVKVERSTLSYQRVFERSRRVADTMARGVTHLLKKSGVEVVAGAAAFQDRNTLLVNGDTRLTARHVLIATGSRPRELPGFAFDGRVVHSSDHALMATSVPGRVLILGGGAIGCEFAHVLSRFGSKVVLAEMLEQLLPLEDADSVALLERTFRKRGIDVRTRTRAVEAKVSEAGASVLLRSEAGQEQRLEVDRVLVVVGRVPNTGGIGLERIGLKPERGFIPVGDHYQTGVAGVYAAGDVVDSPLLAHLASKEAEIAVEHMAGHPTVRRVDPSTVPSAVYCQPQIASFGLSEREAARQGRPIKKAVFPFRADGKAVAISKPEGQVKLVIDPSTHEILGASVVGEGAPELIHELLLARVAELMPEDLARMIHAHPTLSEAVMEAARAAEGWAIHI